MIPETKDKIISATLILIVFLVFAVSLKVLFKPDITGLTTFENANCFYLSGQDWQTVEDKDACCREAAMKGRCILEGENFVCGNNEKLYIKQSSGLVAYCLDKEYDVVFE